MDMTLYALLMKKLQGQSECLTWNGLGVEVVDVMPESPLPNVIYFQKSNLTVEDYSKPLHSNLFVTHIMLPNTSSQIENDNDGNGILICKSEDALASGLAWNELPIGGQDYTFFAVKSATRQSDVPVSMNVKFFIKIYQGEDVVATFTELESKGNGSHVISFTFPSDLTINQNTKMMFGVDDGLDGEGYEHCIEKAMIVKGVFTHINEKDYARADSIDVAFPSTRASFATVSNGESKSSDVTTISLGLEGDNSVGKTSTKQKRSKTRK